MSILKKRHYKRLKPGSMDYYAIVMTTMVALYGAMGASNLIRGERIRKTGDRLIAAPITKAEIFIGKILGNMVANALCILLVVLFSKFVFKPTGAIILELSYLFY